MRSSLLVAAFACAATLLSGCAAQAVDDGVEAEGEVAQSEDALALASLYGTWNAQGGAFISITFTKVAVSTMGGSKGRRFDASIDTGIRCITTPCPSQVDVSGVYKFEHGTQLTLSAYDRPSADFAKVVGEYGVKLTGKTLTLTKRSDKIVVQTLEKAVVHSAAAILSAAASHAWPARGPDYVYRAFDTRAAAEAWGNAQGGGAAWLARDGETPTAVKFVSGSNDLWAQEFTVDKTKLTIVITGEH